MYIDLSRRKIVARALMQQCTWTELRPMLGREAEVRPREVRPTEVRPTLGAPSAGVVPASEGTAAFSFAASYT